MPSVVHRTISRFGTLRRLSWQDRWVLLQALLLVAGIGLALRVTSFNRVHSVLRSLLPPADTQVDQMDGLVAPRALRLARIVDIASRHTQLSNTCLHRSLALWWLLGRRRLCCSLRFGVRKDGGRFQAHAWVEHRGAVINDRPTVGRDYVPLPRFPAKNVQFPS